ncbi:MAG TPA: acyl-CoA dehydrogenase family protein [Acidobacteriota bacterium]|nr:acyl-CoA dehydrogenase family protein [Acidobacteriota bacterium]
MDFSWSEEQLEYKESALRFARQELVFSPECLRQEKFNRPGWEKCARYGIHGLPIPAAYGGSELDPLTTVLILQTLGSACKDNGLLFAINAHIWGCEIPILHYGTESQKRKFLPLLASGQKIGALAAAEPEAGSDAFSVKTVAKKEGNKYVLNGSKMFVTNGAEADVIVVLASLDPAQGWRSLTTFLVEKTLPGYRVKPVEKMGLGSASMGEIFLEDCEVPEENRLGEEGAGSAVFNNAMEWERSFILSSAVGTMERVLNDCLEYSKLRYQFGKPIGKNQLVSSKIVDMKLRLEAAQGFLYRVAWLRSQGKSVFAESAMLKLTISESWVKTCMDALQIHGGYGYLREYDYERELRDAIGSQLFSGTSEIQRNLIAQMMGL